MLRSLASFALLALLVAACGPSSTEVPQNDAAAQDRVAQHDVALDSPVEGDAPVQDDAAGPQDAAQHDAGPATLYPDIRALQQDPSYTGTLAPLNSRVRLENVVVTASAANSSVLFIQNATGPKEYSGIIVKKGTGSAITTMPAVGDLITAIEGTLIEEARGCNWDAGTCPTRHALTNVTLFTVTAGGGTVPGPLGVTTTDVVATTAKYDGVLLQLTDSPLTVGTQPTPASATTTPIDNGMAIYGQFYSPPGVVPSGTVVTTCIGVLDLYNRTWEIDPRSNLDLIFQDWPGDAGIQNDATQLQDGGGATTSDAAACGTDTIVISQVYGGGGNSNATFTNDYIELFNRGTNTADVGAWSVQYASYNGSTWQAVALTGKSIPAGGYLLVQLASGGAVGSALPTPDVTGSINMSATHGKVALVNTATALSGTCPLPNAAIVDFVGFGSDATCAEGSKAPSGSNTTAIIRGAAGCQDFNDNGYDFTAATPAPRTSATTAAPCGC